MRAFLCANVRGIQWNTRIFLRIRTVIAPPACAEKGSLLNVRTRWHGAASAQTADDDGSCVHMRVSACAPLAHDSHNHICPVRRVRPYANVYMHGYVLHGSALRSQGCCIVLRTARVLSQFCEQYHHHNGRRTCRASVYVTCVPLRYVTVTYIRDATVLCAYLHNVRAARRTHSAALGALLHCLNGGDCVART